MKPLEEMGRYATVVVDPPWPIVLGPTLYTPGHTSQQSGGHWDNRLDYRGLCIEEIASLPVSAILDDNAFVFCWTVNQFIPHTYGLLEAWSLSYAFTMTWVKNKGPQFPGKPCFNSEWCIIGRKGKTTFLDCKQFRTANYWERPKHNGSHSEKPEGFYDLLRRVTPAPRLDVFGRRRIAGFESWGNEAPEGPALPDHYQTVFA